MTKPLRNDPRWQEPSASLRQGQLFLKLPRTQANLLVAALRLALQAGEPNLGPEATKYLQAWKTWFQGQVVQAEAAGQPSVILALDASLAAKDSHHLRLIEDQDSSGRIRHIRRVLDQGLESNPIVDWISRVGGPQPDTGPQNLVPRMEPEVELDLEDLF